MLKLAAKYWLKHPALCAIDVATDPLEVWRLAQDDFIAYRERHRPRVEYRADADWEARMHAALGIPWPCPIASEFWELWPSIMRELEEQGIRPGPESFQYWNDGDAGFVRALWCAIRHSRPKTVVETGVAHGVTSRFVLEALVRNGRGRLWSIDFPPFERELRKHVGIAVGDRFADRWTLIVGSSRRRLPALLAQLGEVDLFVHDSLHSERNVRFELDRVWPTLAPGGIMVVDDIDANSGFHSFTEHFTQVKSMVCEAEPVRPDNRRFNRKGLFGVILK